MNTNKYAFQIVIVTLVVIIYSCNNSRTDRVFKSNDSLSYDNGTENITGDINLLSGYKPLHKDGNINAVIEIPAGTLEKWEVDKADGKLKLEYIDDEPRVIRYLGYPANYGMVPGTLLSEYSGGDGDPLDVIVLGPPIARGSVVRCKIIGVMYLYNGGETDDKLIAILAGTPLSEIDDIEELDYEFPGIKDILQLWFTNYKGPGIMESDGFGDKEKAMDILISAISEYKASSL